MNTSHLLLAFTLCAATAKADPLAMHGVGSSVRPIPGGHATIVMVEEEVRVKLPERKVVARYVFHNEGPATTVLMGFPESGETGAEGNMDKVRIVQVDLKGWYLVQASSGQRGWVRAEQALSHLDVLPVRG